MPRLAFATIPVLLLAACSPSSPPGTAGGPPAPAPGTALTWPSGLPVYDHVVVVVEENKDYGQVAGQPDVAPYINGVLLAEGASFTQMYGEEHFSQGNYYWLFSGSNQTVGFNDQVPSRDNNPAYPFVTANLGAQLIRGGRSFKGYAESLPAIGSTVETAGTDEACQQPGEAPPPLYARKHVPWISFANVPNGTTADTSSNLRFADFPTDEAGFATLPTVAFVIPNLHDDMHNCEPPASITTGDAWLRQNLDAYYQWAKEHNSLLIVTFDENDDKRGYQGLTNPLVTPVSELTRDLRNRVVTVFAGARVEPGEYAEGAGITHVNILRTLEAMYGLPRAGAQQPNAAGGGIPDDQLITDVFTTVD